MIIFREKMQQESRASNHGGVWHVGRTYRMLPTATVESEIDLKFVNIGNMSP